MESNPKFSSLINTLGDSIVVSNTSLTKAEINVLLNNIVYPQDVGDSQKELSKRPTEHIHLRSRSHIHHGHNHSNEKVIRYIDYDKEQESNACEKCRKSLTVLDFQKGRPTFTRLKRKLENVRKFYPEIYYKNQNILEVYASNSNPDRFMSSTILDYDEDTADFIWI